MSERKLTDEELAHLMRHRGQELPIIHTIVHSATLDVAVDELLRLRQENARLRDTASDLLDGLMMHVSMLPDATPDDVALHRAYWQRQLGFVPEVES